jgi:hypothetical protein
LGEINKANILTIPPLHFIYLFHFFSLVFSSPFVLRVTAKSWKLGVWY